MKHNPMKEILGIALVCSLVSSAPAKRAEDPPTSYDARVTFVRLRYNYTADPSFGTRQMRDPPWHHDYPQAETNLMHILSEVTSVAPFRDGGRIIDIGDPELLKYPIAYMSEPGFWSMTEQEVENMRNYLLKGGFLIFDDFGGSHWSNLSRQMGRILPKGRWIQLDANHPLFHSFFDIDTFANLQPSYRGQPVFFGLFEDNDTTKRMYAIANYNNDIGENWEWSETGLVPIDAENEAYKFGVDYIIYGLTH
ncbi:MAG TPA: DUF4159 domain-containing protein [Longimicrobiales bacterium]|nr:DUF4159 domain-containing protein [Longimicrobiales bacterium]